MNNAALTVSLLILALFVCWIGFLFIRTVLGGIRQEQQRRQSIQQVQTERFGLLTGEMEVWSGKISVTNHEVPFSVGGTDAAPDEALLKRLEQIIDRYDHYHGIALEYLLKENPSSIPLRFSFHDIDILYPDDPDHFTFSFLLAGDDDGIWRVEFENDQPVFTGRDD